MFEHYDLHFFLKLIYSVIVVTIAYFAPAESLFIGVGAMIMFDFITGIIKAVKLKQQITSRKMSHTISKLVLYNIAIITAYIMEKMFNLDFVPVARIVAVSIGLTELKSVFENINVVTGIDLWKFVLNYLKRNNDQLSETISDTMKEKKN